MSNNTKSLIGIILIILSSIALIVAVIWSIAFKLINPDMTDLRLIIENPYPTIIGCAAVVGWIVGRVLID